jgi:hypothetical protein
MGQKVPEKEDKPLAKLLAQLKQYTWAQVMKSLP